MALQLVRAGKDPEADKSVEIAENRDRRPEEAERAVEPNTQEDKTESDPGMPELEGPFPLSHQGWNPGSIEFDEEWPCLQRGASATAREPREKPARKSTVTHDHGRVTANNAFEKRIADKVEHMENLLGRVAGVQQAQLQRLIDLFDAQQKKATKEVEVTAPVTPAAQAEPAISKPVKEEPVKWEPPTHPGSPEEPTNTTEVEWREYHGETIWQREKDKKRTHLIIRPT